MSPATLSLSAAIAEPASQSDQNAKPADEQPAAEDEAKKDSKREAAADAEKGGTTVKKAPAHRIPPEAVEHYNRGVELHKAGFLNKAIAEYKEAIRADEQMERAYSNLGLIYTAQKNWTKALEAFDTALKIKPDRTTSLNGLGTVLFAMKRTDEAMQKWRRAVEIDPGFASAYYNMANACENDEKYKEAMQYYVKALEINPKMSDAYYRIGSLLNKNKHGAQSYVLLDKAVKMDPDAEFVKDARKQLSTLDKQFKETNAKDAVQTSSASATESGAAKTEPERKVAQSSQATAAATEKKGSGLIKGIFKRPGAAPRKNVDMFVQPPSDGDLKAKPE